MAHHELIDNDKKKATLTRYAKAFYAKVKAAAQRARELFVHLMGDNERVVRPNEGTARRIIRRTLAVPKWIAMTALAGVRLVALTVITVVSTAGLILAALLGALAGLIVLLTMVVYKVCQMIALVIRTPHLIACGDDALKTDWTGYLLMWTPKYFLFTRIQQVFAAQELDALIARTDDLEDDLTNQRAEFHRAGFQVVNGAEAPKGRPTPRNRKKRPSRFPKFSGEPGTAQA